MTTALASADPTEIAVAKCAKAFSRQTRKEAAFSINFCQTHMHRPVFCDVAGHKLALT